MIPAFTAPANSLRRAPLSAGSGVLCHATDAGRASQEGGDPPYRLSEQGALGSRLFIHTASRRGWVLMWFSMKAGRQPWELTDTAFRKMSYPNYRCLLCLIKTAWCLSMAEGFSWFEFSHLIQNWNLSLEFPPLLIDRPYLVQRHICIIFTLPSALTAHCTRDWTAPLKPLLLKTRACCGAVDSRRCRGYRLCVYPVFSVTHRHMKLLPVT